MKSKDIYEGKFVVLDDSENNNSKANNAGSKPRKIRSERTSSRPASGRKHVCIIAVSVAVLLFLITGITYFIGAQTARSEAKKLKSSIKQTILCLKDGDSDSADESIRQAEASIKALRKNLDDGKWDIASAIPFAGRKISEDLDTASKTLDIAEETTEKILKPASLYIRKLGKPELDGIDISDMGPDLAKRIYGYCDMLDDLCPEAEKISSDIEQLPEFNFSILENEVSKYRQIPILAGSMLPVLETASSEILRPAADVMHLVPFSDLKTENGIDTNVVRAYLDLEDKIEPHIVDLLDKLLTDPAFADSVKENEKISNELVHLMTMIYKFKTFKPLIRLIIGDGSDQTFVVIAQNSAEMRACGGYPGSFGIATVRDGEFYFGDFQTIYNVMPDKHASSIKITDEENNIFYSDWYGNNPRRASCNPHFPRAAEVWAKAYEEYNDIKVDGVISVTPHIIQRLLTITGPVTLSNGKTVDCENVLDYLQRQIYIDYFLSVGTTEANNITDSLFAETAVTVYKKVFDNISKDSLMSLFNILTDCGRDRIFMMWMDNEEAEQTIYDLGLSGALNYDPESPELSVFFSVDDANKLGPYLDYSITYGDGTENEDGTITYDVKVVVSNIIDEETLRIGEGNSYILSYKYGGSMNSLIYMFAPAGGSVSDFENDADLKVTIEEYNGLMLGFCPYFLLDPGETITFTYKATTAPYVTTKPVTITQPLLAGTRDM